MTAAVSIRAAAPADVPLLHELIVALAVYEREPDAVTGTAEMLGESLFGPTPAAEAVIATVDGATAGFAIFHGTFSTWECTHGMWLEDLFVLDAYRRSGVGGELLRHLARTATERGCARLEWAALDWNTPALRFYERIGAEVLTDWTMHRLEGATLASVAAGTPTK